MRARTVVAAAVVGLGLAGASLLAARSAPAANPTRAAAAWQVDGVHSSVVFAIQHLSAAWFHGTFGKTEGAVTYDPGSADGASVSVTIHADSVHTHDEKRDGHVKSPDFLNVKQFPTITFRSTKVEAAGTDKLSVTGDLTFLGVTKSITVPVEFTGSSSDPKMGTRAGFLATFTIKRSEFGSTYAAGMMSDEIRLTVSLETVKQ
jgi:polyisoprenoid-binding protein YceI